MLQNRAVTKKGKAKLSKASEIEAKRLNRVNTAKNKKNAALGKKKRKKTTYTAAEALRRKRKHAMVAIAVAQGVRVAVKVKHMNDIVKGMTDGEANVGDYAKARVNASLSDIAGKKRAKDFANRAAAKRGIGTAQSHVKTKAASYARSRGRGKGKVYKITSAKRARRR